MATFKLEPEEDFVIFKQPRICETATFDALKILRFVTKVHQLEKFRLEFEKAIAIFGICYLEFIQLESFVQKLKYLCFEYLNGGT